MGRPINKRDYSNKNYGDVRGSRSPGAMKERILIDIVHIESRGQKPRGDKESRGNRRLQCESAAVVSNFAHGPEQRQGKSEVKAGEQPDPDRYARVPHILGSADEKSSGDEAPADVDGPKNSRRQRADRLAGNQQGTSPPQTRATKNYGDIAQMQQIGPAPKSNVGGQPHHRPKQPNPAKHRERVCAG